MRKKRNRQGRIMMKKIIYLLTVLFLLCGCSTVISVNETEEDNSAYDLSFSEDDLDASYAVNGSTYIELGNEDIQITKAGTYILEGTMNDASIIVNVSEDDKVQLVLNNVTISSGDFAGIYIIEADEVTITLADDSVNTISESGTYTLIDDNNVDALIYSKADLVINGNGTLNLRSAYNHGIVSKDDLIIAGGTYSIDVAGQALSGKDCLKVSDGTFDISSGKDALKSDNSEDEGRGYVYISGGSFTIDTLADGIYGYSLVKIEGGDFTIATSKSSSADSYKAVKSDALVEIAGGNFTIDSADDGLHSNGDILISDGDLQISSSDDGIHADGMVQIDGGNITVTANEGIEGTYVRINEGTISINAGDDGINAGQKSNLYSPTVEINGGSLTIVMGQGDTDGIDSNGSIYINGGTIDITAQSPFDYDQVAEHNGGTIIVNGEETETITNQMMGGMGGFGGHMPQDGGESGSWGGQIPGGGHGH